MATSRRPRGYPREEWESGRSSALTTPHLQRRREERELRRVLGTELLHPAQRAIVEQGGGVARGAPLRSALTTRRDLPAPAILLERAPAPAPTDPPAEAPAPAPARTPAKEARPKPWSGDAVAQAQTLRDAARDGVPFCAVCEAARRERERQAAAR
jgi:hypothetical protein